MRLLAIGLVLITGCGSDTGGSTDQITAGAVGVTANQDRTTIGGSTGTTSATGGTTPIPATTARTSIGGSTGTTTATTAGGTTATTAGGTTATTSTPDRSGVGGTTATATTTQTTAGGTTATGCVDTPRPQETCVEAVTIGLCSQSWFAGYCSKSCGKCSTGTGGTTAKATTAVGGTPTGTGGATTAAPVGTGKTQILCCLRTTAGTTWEYVAGNPPNCKDIGPGWIPDGPSC